MKKTMKVFEQEMNEWGIPEDQIYGKHNKEGYVPETVSKYGSWLRRNDPIAFRTYYFDWLDAMR